MIPELVDINGIWKMLPPGIHNATLSEVEKVFAYNSRRIELFQGLVKGLKALEISGCKKVYLDGSFVTEKDIPGDFDVCWDVDGFIEEKLDPVLLNFENKRQLQKEKYGGEFFISSGPVDGQFTFLEFFQIDKYTKKQKGILCIELNQEVQEERYNDYE